jgi:hypothetical protein
VDVAISVAKSVGILLSTAVATAQTVKQIHGILSDIQIQKEKTKLQKFQLTQSQVKTPKLCSSCHSMKLA